MFFDTEGAMSFIPKIACLMVLAGSIVVPVLSRAQSPQGSSSAAGVVLNEQQKMGQGLFMQNCALCHLPKKENVKSSTEPGTTVGPPLNGVFRGEKPITEAVARTFIVNGSKDKMPSFKYGLEPKEVDAIIAYLKTL